MSKFREIEIKEKITKIKTTIYLFYKFKTNSFKFQKEENERKLFYRPKLKFVYFIKQVRTKK